MGTSIPIVSKLHSNIVIYPKALLFFPEPIFPFGECVVLGYRLTEVAFIRRTGGKNGISGISARSRIKKVVFSGSGAWNWLRAANQKGNSQDWKA